ncbi:MAG: hypothetical protein Q9181_003660 [Wetmoreana brouardii]
MAHEFSPWAHVSPSSETDNDDPILNAPDAFATAPSSVDGNSSGPRKRKAPAAITHNACTSCKKARSKCDGLKPCQRCISRQMQHSCHYEIHSKAAKDQLMGEIRRLRQENHGLVQRNLDLSESNELLKIIFQSLKDDRQCQEVGRRLKRGDDHQSIADWLARYSIDTSGQIPPVLGQQFVGGVGGDLRNCAIDQSPFVWSDGGNNTALLEQLMTLSQTDLSQLYAVGGGPCYVDSPDMPNRMPLAGQRGVDPVQSRMNADLAGFMMERNIFMVPETH